VNRFFAKGNLPKIENNRRIKNILAAAGQEEPGKRADIKPGARVRVVQKHDQPSGKLTEGVVKDILTRSPDHPHGIKVRLVSGLVGRVKEILSEGS
jgi:uncharacterized repeat protein (TIGR03833 family)